MLQSVPQLAMAKPRLLGSFRCPTQIIVQVTDAHTLYLAETENALMQTSDSGLIDALQITIATGIITFWWYGDLWAAGSAIPFFPLIIIMEGVTTGSALGVGQHAYGMKPTTGRAQ
jgi:hypothetical protein